MGAHAPYILFRDDRRGESLVFAEPREIVVARAADEVLPALERLERARTDGAWLAGYISYEGSFGDNSTTTTTPSSASRR